MPTVEKIEKSKHKQERVLVFLREGDLLRITETELLRFGLCKGAELTDEQIAELKAAGARSETRAAAARMASGRMLSKKELQKRLVRKGAEEADAAETADWLEELGAVDDCAYAASIVRHYGGMGYGPARVQQELYRRGIPRELWEDALAQMPPAQEAIERYARSRLRGCTPDAAAVKKLYDALLRRGFSRNDIRPVIRALGQEISEDDL